MPKHSHSEEIAKIEEVAIELRKSVIEMLLEAGSGHSAGPLGTEDIFASLYFHILNIDPKNPQMPDRDRLVLSAGHICPLLSATLNDQTHRVYCGGSDAELQEGQIWEAAMFAGNNHLHNLTWIIDRNNIQIDGYTEDIMPLEPLRQKLEAFNWHVLEIDGHNVEEIINACDNAKAIFERATVIITHTIPGKDVDFMQYKFEWHGKPPNRVQAEKALKELRTLAGRIRSEHD